MHVTSRYPLSAVPRYSNLNGCCAECSRPPGAPDQQLGFFWMAIPAIVSAVATVVSTKKNMSNADKIRKAQIASLSASGSGGGSASVFPPAVVDPLVQTTPAMSLSVSGDRLAPYLPVILAGGAGTILLFTLFSKR